MLPFACRTISSTAAVTGMRVMLETGLPPAEMMKMEPGDALLKPLRAMVNNDFRHTFGSTVYRATRASS